jgi:NADPH-dependent F420 reductase
MLGFIGGTGREGRGLGLRFALAGERVLIGSRDEGRAREAAEGLAKLVPPGAVSGALNEEVARQADVVFVTVPYAAQKDTLSSLKNSLAGKIVVSAVVPLSFDDGRIASVPVAEGSAALQAKAILGASRLVAAFHTIDARDLLSPQKPIVSDVVVCSDDDDAKALVMGLAEKIKGIRAVNGGGLQNAGYVEGITALLANINRIYKAHSSIKIVGI